MSLDVRALCLGREILSWNDSLADFAFAMQGLGTGSISLFGTEQQKPGTCRRYARAAISPPSRCRSPKPGRT